MACAAARLGHQSGPPRNHHGSIGVVMLGVLAKVDLGRVVTRCRLDIARLPRVRCIPGSVTEANAWGG